MNVYEKIDKALHEWFKRGLYPSHIVVHRSSGTQEEMRRLGDAIVDHRGYSIDILVSTHDHIRYGEVFCVSVVQNIKPKTLWQKVKYLLNG